MALDYSTLKTVIENNGPWLDLNSGDKRFYSKGPWYRNVCLGQGTHGTIGGGTLEFEAIKAAREILETKKTKLKSYPLGPELGQCCGGFVKLVTEYYDQKDVSNLKDQNLNVRSLSSTTETPKTVAQFVRNYKTETIDFDHKLSEDWLLRKLLLRRCRYGYGVLGT